MKQLYDFDEIRPLYDEEVPEIIQSLLREPGFKHAVEFAIPGVDYRLFSEQMSKYTNKHDFQSDLVVPFLLDLAANTTDGLSISGLDNISKNESYTFMSNHRDIVLDASFLNTMLITNGFDTSEVAIGDNLLIFPWISNLVRLNKSFIVKRDVTVRQMLDISKRLSNYINFAIKIKHQSVWIAQRQGRAKNSDDRTQDSLLKMLNLGGGHDLRTNLEDLRIVPVAISYEYDPCDYLKAKEFQQRRDKDDYKKEAHEDLLSMETGLLGNKGRVHFQISKPLNDELETWPAIEDKAEELTMISQLIDKRIHSAYRIYPGNYVAYDMLNKCRTFADKYTRKEEERFAEYLQKQAEKVNLPHPDIPFLKEKMLEMYANPLKNQLEALRQ